MRDYYPGLIILYYYSTTYTNLFQLFLFFEKKVIMFLVYNSLFWQKYVNAIHDFFKFSYLSFYYDNDNDLYSSHILNMQIKLK